jgi:sec-independent protein translocase protein TatA
MSAIGLPELVIIVAIALLLFGVGRIGKLGGELGSGIRAFKNAVTQEITHDDHEDR